MSTKEKFLEFPRVKKWREERLGSSVSGQKEHIIGEGKLVERATGRLDRITERVKSRQVIPAVRERFETWRPGQRLEKLLPLGMHKQTFTSKERVTRETIPQKSRVF